jgi:hypothetical protein
MRALAALLLVLALPLATVAQEDSNAPWPSPLTLDVSSAQRLPNRCLYTILVTGTLHGNPDALVSALSVAASVNCAAEATLLGEDDRVWEGPHALRALEAELERRGRIVTDASGRSCSYVPELAIERTGVRLVDVVMSCPPK